MTFDWSKLKHAPKAVTREHLFHTKGLGCGKLLADDFDVEWDDVVESFKMVTDLCEPSKLEKFHVYLSFRLDVDTSLVYSKLENLTFISFEQCGELL